MSNEYRDWEYDAAQDVALDHHDLIKIDSTTVWNDGYLITGRDKYDAQVACFVWLSAYDGWHYRQIDI